MSQYLRPRRGGSLGLVALALLSLSCASKTVNPKSKPEFTFTENKLTVKTEQLTLTIEGGSVTYAKDKASGEILVDTSSYINRPSDVRSFVGFISKDAQTNLTLRWPNQSSAASFEMSGDSGGRLTYSPLYSDGQPSNSQLVMDVKADPATGEVIVQLTGVEADTALKPDSVALPIMNSAALSVILGSGAEYLRAEAEATDQTKYSGFGLNGPTMAVIRGSNSALAVWSETVDFPPELIRLDHTPACDQLVLHTGQDPKQADRQRIVSSPWRIGTYRTWAKAAKRWREKFEERTGAKPLWENRAAWVRNIHAVFDATNQTYFTEPEKFATLAGLIVPRKVIYMVWNADRIVLYGDHRYIIGAPRPTPEETATVLNCGWPLLVYYPYDLIYSETGTQTRLAFLAQQGWLPSGYVFTPDYAGTPENWRSYWDDITAKYFDGSTFDVLHPGASKFKDYIVHNLEAYSAVHSASGVYMDILGDVNDFFAGGPLVIEGQDYLLGEANALARLAQSLPQIAIMSEYLSPWVSPYVFYSWEGAVTHLKNNPLAHARTNHPLRVALTGSYSWGRESNAEEIDDIAAALLGTLPQVSLVGDYGVSDERALWSQARAKLFCEQELFSDVPDPWDSDALAYYRSKNGNWFKFRRLGSTYGYVEVLSNGQEVVRLSR